MMNSLGQRVWECEGWWEQARFGRQQMSSLRLEYQGLVVRGHGTDIVGPFTLLGAMEPEGRLRLVKQYVNRHAVNYHGEFDGEGCLFGAWNIGTDQGRWSIKLLRVLGEGTSESTLIEP